MSTIKNIIFDFGGVLVDLEPEHTYDAFRVLYHISRGEALPDELLDIFSQYEKGHFGEGSFMHRLQRLSTDIIRERELLDAWNAMLIDFPLTRLQWLEDLRKRYKLYLLSNINHTHLEWIRSFLARKYDIEDFESHYFDGVFYSHQLGLSKPNVEIYKSLLKDIVFEESLFIDDTMTNVEAARSIGLPSIWHPSNSNIVKRFSGYLTDAGKDV